MLFDFKNSGIHFDLNEQFELTKTVESLSRFGLLIKNTAVLELNYDYASFEEHWFYKAILPKLNEGSTVRVTKYRIELTRLGQDFVCSCLPDDATTIEE